MNVLFMLKTFLANTNKTDTNKKTALTSGYFSEKRGLKNIYEKLCLKYTKILSAFNILNINNSKESINSSKRIIYSCNNILHKDHQM